MGYANITEVEMVLGQALTSAMPNSSDQKFNLINVGDTRDVNRISDDLVEFYIMLADSQVDGILSQQYQTPFEKCAHGQWDLDADIDEYNPLVEISDTTNLIELDEMIIRDDANPVKEELHFVSTIIDNNRFTTVSPIITTFIASETTRVLRIAFPRPINQISARLAAAFIYDKYYSAQVSPNISDYGEKMRDIAMGQLNDILNGKTILDCGKRIGDRFGGPTLDDTYALRDRGFATGDRDMSKL